MSIELNEFVSRRSAMEYAARTMLGVSILPAGILSAADDKGPKSNDGKTSKSGTETKVGSAKHVIFLYMNGAMTHLDTFDLKPGQETQGETKGIATNVPGMQFGQTLPELAKIASIRKPGTMKEVAISCGQATRKSPRFGIREWEPGHLRFSENRTGRCPITC
jgi:hypothetical protein